MADCSDAALLLRRIPYGDTSLICHFLSEHHGRITLMARGARRARSPFRASLAPLHRLHLHWKSGRSGMGVLVDVQRHERLLSEEKSLAGLELLALVSRLYQEGDPEGYEQTQQSLRLLADRAEREGLNAACWHLLHMAGWIGDLGHCWMCGEPADAGVDMFWRQGQLCCAGCGGGTIIAPGLRRGIEGAMRQANVRLSGRDAADWRQMIGLVLREHGVRFHGQSGSPEYQG